MSNKAWRLFGPLYFYIAVVLFLIFAALGKGPSRSLIVLLVFLGFLSWGLVEYVLHRFVFHFDAHSINGRRLLYAAHLSHHDNPMATDRLFATPKMSLPIAAAYWLVAWAALGSWRAASYLFIGLVAGYFLYEWLHFQAHHGRPKLPILRYLKKYHLLHHHRNSEVRFGVTSPFFDLIFGTFRPVSDRTR